MRMPQLLASFKQKLPFAEFSHAMTRPINSRNAAWQFDQVELRFWEQQIRAAVGA